MISPASQQRQPGAVTVVYIAGSGRSGSTLLERALGEMPGYVNVGELIDLFRRDASRAERCGCGRHFADCEFWDGVGKRAFGGWGGAGTAEVHPLQRRVARQRAMPRLAAPALAGRGFRADAARYGSCYAALYQAIREQAGADRVVDASKWPVQALALWRAGVDVRVIHLVRDVRGVAYSLTKRAKRPAATAARWVLHECQAALLRRCGPPFTRVRYEDFVRAPRHTIETALAELGLAEGGTAGPAPRLDHLSDTRVTLHPSHGIHGNPSRWQHGEIALRLDETWRQRMPWHDRILVTAIGLPFLLRYGWRPRLGRA